MDASDNPKRDIIDLLAEIGQAKPGDPMPPCIDTGPHSWGIALSEIASRARAEILMWRGLSTRVVELENHLARKGPAPHD